MLWNRHTELETTRWTKAFPAIDSTPFGHVGFGVIVHYYVTARVLLLYVTAKALLLVWLATEHLQRGGRRQ
jgi:hypothetical protein